MNDFDQALLEAISDTRCSSIGPRIAQIDLTGRCNNNCIGCWVHSPFIKNPPHDKNITLPFERVKELVESLSRLGAEEIFLSGAGEPFLHPNIIEIIELIKSKELKLNIISNFTLVDEQRIRALLELGVDMVTASIWAAAPETYIKTHPGKTESDFYRIKDNLKKLSEIKLKENKCLPHIKIYNVICNLNYAEIDRMIDFGLDTQAESIEFQIMDIIEGETSFLALSDKQVRHIKSQFDALTGRHDLCFKDLKLFNVTSLKEKELKEFPGRFAHIPEGFSLSEKIKKQENAQDKLEVLRSLTCPRGVRTKPSFVNPVCDDDNNIFTFTFPYEECKKHSCPDCPADKDGQLKVRFLSILGFISFMRRLNSSNVYEQVYEKRIINNLPCYIGWSYSRILSTGEVIPCCKAALKPLGNINGNNFLDIWRSDAYQEFRHKASSLPKSDFYFNEINCYKSCDNVGMNLKIKELASSQKRQRNQRPGRSPYIPSETDGHLPEAQTKITLRGRDFVSGNLNIRQHTFGRGIAIDGGCGFGFAEYKMNFKETGKYELWSCYAAQEARPLELYFDGELIAKEALGNITGGWKGKDLIWFKEGELEVSPGGHTLKIYTKGLIPHIHSFVFLKGIKDSQVRQPRKYLSENIYQEPSALKILRDKIRSAGLVNSVSRTMHYIRSGKLFNNYLEYLGIFNGSYAFKGPHHVQIDLTNDCNNNCIGCWCNSPLLEEKILRPEIKKQTLPLGLLRMLLDELAAMGTKEIYFSGGGEPFMHPQIMDILSYAKKKGFTCYINTNFTLVDKEKVKRLIDLGVEHLTVSTWAASPKVYALTHPNKNEETFRQIKENLGLLNRIKRQTPYIKLYNVLFNVNYHEFKEMIYLAKETGSDSVEFTLIDTIPGKTDKLLLDQGQIKRLQESAEDIAGNIDSQGYYDGVFLFRFDSFLRRISSALDLSMATYDRNIIDKIPCYVGWCFSRIMPNGDVNACLKAHRTPVGNIYQEDFYKIWNGTKQRYFRRKTLVYEKKDPFFRLIGNDPATKEAGCYKSCDDIGRNIYLHNRIMSLSSLERRVLKVASKIKQKPSLNPVPREEKNDPAISGIIDGRRAFCGPEQAVIDITNRCNERCAGCWLYSPLLKKKTDDQWLKQEIDFHKARRLIDDLADLGTKRIRFTGGGEPFAYPRFMELVEHVKARRLICCLTTNFSLLDAEKVKELIRIGVDELSVSLWASDERSYEKTHFQARPGAFKRIQENLSLLIDRKRGRPFVTLCNVICNLNYRGIEEMFRFALDMKADGIYFTLVDAIAGETDSLLLDGAQRQEALRQAEKVKAIWHGISSGGRIKLDYFDGFISRLKEEGSSRGDYDLRRVSRIPCYAGWIFTRILADGTVSPCCRGVKKPMGNINEQDFRQIWFSQGYNEFRSKAKYLPKTDPYFSAIGCTKMCDNLMHNEQAHARLGGAV